MMNQVKFMITLIISLSLILSQIKLAQAKSEVNHHQPTFSKIEQPLPLKILVTLGGLGLIITEVWWFLLSKNQDNFTNDRPKK
jgi:plastocyanin domain-containing protein